MIGFFYQNQKQDIQAVYFKSLISIDIFTSYIIKNKGKVYICWNSNTVDMIRFCTATMYTYMESTPQCTYTYNFCRDPIFRILRWVPLWRYGNPRFRCRTFYASCCLVRFVLHNFIILKSTLISYVLFVVPWSPYCYICGNYYLGYLPSWLTSWFLANYMKLWLCISLQNYLYSHTFLCFGCKPS